LEAPTFLLLKLERVAEDGAVFGGNVQLAFEAKFPQNVVCQMNVA
jgi:hypothetical protein